MSINKNWQLSIFLIILTAFPVLSCRFSSQPIVTTPTPISSTNLTIPAESTINIVPTATPIPTTTPVPTTIPTPTVAPPVVAYLAEQTKIRATGQQISDLLPASNAKGYAVTEIRHVYGGEFDVILSKGSGYSEQMFGVIPRNQFSDLIKEINNKGYAITDLTFVAGWTKNDANYVAVLSKGSGLTDQILVEGIDQGEPTFIAEFGMKSEPFADLLKEANAQGYAVTEFDGQRAILSKGSSLSEQVFIDNLTEKNMTKFLKDSKTKGYAITGFSTTLNNGIRAILSKGIKFQDQIIVNIGTDSQDFDKILNEKKYALTLFTFNINTLGYLVLLSQY